LTAKLWATAQFNDFALATVATAGELYGAGGQVQTTIADAWSAVGLPVPPRLTKRTAVKPIRPANRPVRRLRGVWRERKAA
ncbi:MAG TPA: M4 family metallopeptidase, partial [Thermoanaerobaculia bacterium]